MKKHLTSLISLALSVLAIVIIGTAQTPDEFKQKYGSPDSEGRYAVRPNISLSIKYKQNRNLSEMIIEPLDSTANASNSEKQGSNKLMLSEEAEAVFDELVPVAKRGKKGNTGTAEFGCTSVEHTEYERLTTNIVKRCERQGGGTYSIDVRWNK